MTRLLIVLFAFATSAQAASKPNFILIMCDDLGWGDVGFNGGKHIRTPHLDKMAANGLKLTRFYAQAPVCSPTRASVVTGRHHDRTGIYTANNGHLRDGEFTLYEALAAKGYATGHFGKWHMGTLTRTVKESNRGAKKPENYSPPWNHAVDTTFATEAKTPTFDPMWKPVKSDEVAFGGNLRKGWNQISAGEKKELYGTHYWTAEETMVDPESEKLMGDDSKIIMDRALEFIEAEHGSPFLAIIWFHAPHLPAVAGREDAASYDNGSATGFEQNYYGCVTALDREVGRLRALLREKGVAENTFVAFCSDNGPEGKDGAPGKQGPFRGRKRSLYEGGVRVPSVIEWPAKIEPGSTSGVASCTVDYFPTIMDIVGFKMPDKRPLDGVNLLPLINGSMSKRPRPLAFHIRGKAAWHDGMMKAYGDVKKGKWELYDLAADPRESADLASQKPQELKSMIAAWTRWKASVDASDNGADY
ncbi:MAG: N-acetylgalactosamine 6-sulfate sulfatase [Verrucomicrobiales bacterium]|nr:N-acetylgalactosamine 6-sulfate sulfatase [Verrucomicrobiales bacterium]|tara:strand:+ start:341 stop:1762 length:1422 start_codon:yes stop_codon:yes gene_type:complete